jgi:hypothetical protein
MTGSGDKGLNVDVTTSPFIPSSHHPQSDSPRSREIVTAKFTTPVTPYAGTGSDNLTPPSSRDIPAWASPGEGNRDLMREALTMSVNKNLVDVTTLLQWAHAAADAGEKRRHVRQALTLMQDLDQQLADLDARH